MTKLIGTYEMSKWEETPVRAQDHPQKCTRVDAGGAMSGDMEGEAQTSYHLAYISEKQVVYTGYTHFSGVIDGQNSMCVLLENGTFADNVATSTWEIVAGSGTGALQGATGQGGFASGHGQKVAYTLEVNFEQ